MYKWTLAILVAAVLALSGCAASSSATGAPAPAAAGTTAAPAKAAPTAAPPTTSQANALAAAQNYLSDGMGFSKVGLIQQLDSAAGDGYPKADAVWAVAHAGADWNAQAVLSAKNYMSSGSFSRSALIEQLSSSAGEGFTHAQAVYAVGKVGL